MNPDDDTLPATPDSAQPSRSIDVPAKIGRFEIIEKLGQGGMGIVLLATDPDLGRRVAIKVLRGNAIGDTAKQRLLREAQGTAKLSHENVIVVHEVGTHGDQIYLAMEYVAGQTLRRWQARKEWREILDHYVRAARGLQAAHDAGLVHRDFKPDNVLVGNDGRVRVTDFGLVAATGARTESAGSQNSGSELDSTLTQTGAVLGTPRYMAPEQHLGEPVDARADQFAFCVALYEALYGQPPFIGATYAEISASVIEAKPAPVPATDVPQSVTDAVLRGLRRDREDRHRSMRELVSALAVDAAAVRRKRWPILVALAGGAAAIAAVALVTMQRSGSGERPAASVAKATVSQLDVESLRPAVIAFDNGRAMFRAVNYDEAVTHFQDGYAALKAPQFLHNLGAAYFMKAKRDGDAASYRRATELYTQYLASDPIAPGLAEAIDAMAIEIARLDAGGDRSPSAAIRNIAEPQVRGFLLFNSIPDGATVYIDDPTKGPVGTTPWVGTLEGKHVIYIAKPGFKTVQHVDTFDPTKFSMMHAMLRELTPPQ
jgi:predicted Ser/Thr protein kinase